MSCITLDDLKKAIFAVAEKELARSEDVSCIFTNGDSPVGKLSEAAVENLIDCNRSGTIRFQKAAGPALRITVLFGNCPQYVKEIQTYLATGAACPEPPIDVASPDYTVIETDGAETNLGAVPTASLTPQRKILGYFVEFPTPADVTIAKFVIRTFGEKRVDVDASGITVNLRSSCTGDPEPDSVDADVRVGCKPTGPCNPVPIAEKDILSAADIRSITDGATPLTGDEIDGLFDCDPTTLYGIVTDLTIVPKIPQYIEEVEILDGSDVDIIGEWSLAYTSGAVIVVEATGHLKVKDILKSMVRSLTFTPLAVPVGAAQIVIRTYGSKHVHAPPAQPVTVNKQNEIVRVDIARAEIDGGAGFVLLTETDVQALFDKRPSVLVNVANATLRFTFNAPRQIESMEALDQFLRDVDVPWQVETPEDPVGAPSIAATSKHLVVKRKVTRVTIGPFGANVSIAELLFKTFDESEVHGNWQQVPLASFATLDAYGGTNLRDVRTRPFKTKTYTLKNTGANGALVRVKGDYGAGTFPAFALAEFLLVAGAQTEYDEDRAYAGLRFEARAAVAGLQTTVSTEGDHLGV